MKTKTFILALLLGATLATYAQGTEKRVRVYKGNTIAYEENYADVDSIVFVNAEKPVNLEGTLSGKFSLPVGNPVQFSQGNLQYQAATNTWKFAEHQYDVIGAAGNSYISRDYNGWIDLFGWGTGDNPTKASTDASVYTTFTDWGVNPISNGGNTPNQWRTLTQSELNYILYARPNADKLWGIGTVNNVPGLILLPDDWILPDGIYFYGGKVYTYSINEYTTTEWAKMEAAGAVLLPVSGYRSGVSVSAGGGYGYYWTAAPASYSLQFHVYNNTTYIAINDNYKSYAGMAVRLVH